MSHPIIVGCMIGVTAALVGFQVFRVVRACKRFDKHCKAYDAASEEAKRCKSIAAMQARFDQMDAALREMRRETNSI